MQEFDPPKAGNAPLSARPTPREGGGEPVAARTFLLPLAFSLLHITGQVIGLWLTGMFIFYYRAMVSSPGSSYPAQSIYDPNLLAVGMIVTAVMLIPLYLWYLHSRERIYPGTYFREKADSGNWIRMIVLILACQGATYLLMTGIEGLSEKIPFFSESMKTYTDVVNTLSNEKGSLILMSLSVAIAAPVMEELLFRGIMLGEFLRSFRAPAAIGLQALIFGLFHGNFIQGSYAFLVGIALGYAYWKSRSILLSIALHVIFNFLGGVMPTLLGQNSLAAQILAYLQISIFVLVLLAALTRLFRRRRPEADLCE